MEIVRWFAPQISLLFFEVMDVVTTYFVLLNENMSEQNPWGGLWIPKIMSVGLALFLMTYFNWGKLERCKWFPVIPVATVVIINILNLL